MKSAALVFCGAVLSAQDVRFDVPSRLVLVPVNVFTAQGAPVAGLEAADFQVLDNGRPRKIVVDSIDTGVARIALIAAVQSSAVSRAAIEKIRKIGGMIQPVITGERGCAGLVSFDDQVRWIQECTNDGDLIRAAFRNLAPSQSSNARMLDAVASAIDHLSKERNARRVLLLLSETRDRGSEATLEQAIVAAQRSGVAVYAVTYSAFATAFTSKAPVFVPKRKVPHQTPEQEAMKTWNGAPPGKYNPKVPPAEERVDIRAGITEFRRLFGPNSAGVLSSGTGGAMFSFTRDKALEEAIQRFGEDLHSQYVVSFVPDVEDGEYHTIDVRVTRPGGFHVRARPGYRQ